VSSRKEQKEQARLEREAKQAELQAKSARDRRLKIFGGVVGLAVIAVFVAIVISTSGGDSESTPEQATEVVERFEGIPQTGITVGEPEAKATIVEFADLKCPFCAEFAVESLPTVVDELVRSGKAKLVFRNLTFLDQVTPGEPDSTNAAKYAQAVGLQNKLWQFVDLFYLNQGPENQVFATESFLKDIASQIPGVDPDKAWEDRNDPKVQAELDEADEVFNGLGLSGTPAFAVGPDEDNLDVVNVSDLSDPQPLIDAVEALQ
jgi:protein-disulfide isomerase